ncbi:MAG TPA: hypothetical protein VEZ72_10015, partial [Paenibacillus sp.]|nr:hypothetical protein [Paenibacillus sp.]
MKPYEEMQQRLASGWNTWNTASVLSHVLLPDGFAVNVGFKTYREPHTLKEALIGRHGAHEEVVTPGPRTYDGGYAELRLAWRGLDVTVRSGTIE